FSRKCSDLSFTFSYFFTFLFLFFFFFFFFNDPATTEIYTLSLHDALPIFIVFLFGGYVIFRRRHQFFDRDPNVENDFAVTRHNRSEEHTSELQSLAYLVCRLLLEKKKKKK